MHCLIQKDTRIPSHRGRRKLLPTADGSWCLCLKQVATGSLFNTLWSFVRMSRKQVNRAKKKCGANVRWVCLSKECVYLLYCWKKGARHETTLSTTCQHAFIFLLLLQMCNIWGRIQKIHRVSHWCIWMNENNPVIYWSLFALNTKYH